MPGAGAIDGFGVVLTVTVAYATPLQPAVGPVPITVYVVVWVGFTLMDWVLWGGVVDQLYVNPPLAVNVAPVDPVQIVASAVVTLGEPPMVIAPVAVDVHVPIAPVTVYVVVMLGLSVMLAVVCAGMVAQVYVVAPVAVNVVGVPGHTAAAGNITPTWGF